MTEQQVAPDAQLLARDYTAAIEQPLRCRVCEHWRLQAEMSIHRGRQLSQQHTDAIEELRALHAANIALVHRNQQLFEDNLRMHNAVYKRGIEFDEAHLFMRRLQLEVDKLQKELAAIKNVQ